MRYRATRHIGWPFYFLDAYDGSVQILNEEGVYMKYPLLVLAVVTLSALPVFAQSERKAEDKPAAQSSKYDAELAKKVGADENGMRKYVLAILKTGPKDAEVQGDGRKAIFKGHFENMNRLAAEGKLAVAGPFADPEKKYRGLFILAVETVEAAKALA